jgi:hypothetical protein
MHPSCLFNLLVDSALGLGSPQNRRNTKESKRQDVRYIFTAHNVLILQADGNEIEGMN